MSDIQHFFCMPRAAEAPRDYELSDIDALALPLMVPFFLVYALPSADNHIRAEIVERLKEGLEKTLVQFPIQLGHVCKDGVSQKVVVKRSEQDRGVQLSVRGLNGDSALPSFEELRSAYFHPTRMPSQLLLPMPEYDPKTQASSQNGQPSCLFQINFIDGGLILASSVNHVVADGPSHDIFMQQWARNSKTSDPAQASDVHLQRSLLKSQVQGVSKDRLDALKARLDSVVGDALKPPRKRSPQDAEFTISRKLLHFRQSKSQSLKAEILSLSGQEVSTMSAITALMWRCITKARLPLRKPAPEAVSAFYVGVGFRGRQKVNVPQNYFGNAVMLARAGPIPVTDVVGDKGLQLLATSMKSAIDAVDQSFVDDLVEWSGNKGPDDSTRIMVNSHLSLDVLASSWADNSCYETCDFGFGLPKALASPDHKIETCIVFPKQTGEDEGLTVSIGLEEKCMERLLNDPELQRYAEERGPRT